MKTIKTLCTTALCGVFVASAPAADQKSQQDGKQNQTKTQSAESQNAKPKNIVATARQAGQFKTLIKAVKAAGLAETLRKDGPFTVFAPTDAAFEALPEGKLESLLKPENKDQLEAVLTYHVVPKRVPAKQVTGMSEAATVEGSMLAISQRDGAVFIDDAEVTKTDVKAKNGLIHVIDSVLMPSDDKQNATAGNTQPATPLTRTSGYGPVVDPSNEIVTSPATTATPSAVSPTLDPGETGAVERPGGGTNENAGRALRDSIRPGAGE